MKVRSNGLVPRLIAQSDLNNKTLSQELEYVYSKAAIHYNLQLFH